MRNDEKIDINLTIEETQDNLSEEELAQQDYETALRYINIAEHMNKFEDQGKYYHRAIQYLKKVKPYKDVRPLLRELKKKKFNTRAEGKIELYKEEQAYLWQLGKASINRKSMKAVTNYLIDSLNCSFLLIGECQDTAKLMDMLYELRKNPNEIVDIINFVCCGENKVIYLLQGNDGASLICFSV